VSQFAKQHGYGCR